MEARCAGFERGDTRRDAEPAIAVAVPVDPDVDAQLVDERLHEADHRLRAIRCRVSDRVGDAQALDARADRRRIQQPQRVGVGPRGIFRYVHRRQPLLDGEGKSVFGALLQVFDRPAFGVLADGARADERTALDRHAGPLLNLGDWRDVGRHRAGGAVRANLQPRVPDGAGEALDVARHSGSGAGQADVGRVDSERIHVMENVDLFVDAGGPNRRRLQTVAERLVVEHRDRPRTRRIVIPVVDQRVRRHTQEVTSGNRTAPEGRSCGPRRHVYRGQVD